MREERGVPDAEIHRFIDAMATDIHKCRYDTYDELASYVRGSAAAVGVMMQAIMDVENPDRARPHAIALGEVTRRREAAEPAPHHRERLVRELQARPWAATHKKRLTGSNADESGRTDTLTYHR